MFSNTKLLVTASTLIILFGFTLIWFGLKSPAQVIKPETETAAKQTFSVDTDQPATFSATKGIEGERAYVAKVIDGDTIELTNGQTVRLIGIDTPETKDPRRPVGCFGKEASSETRKLLSGKEIILQKDVSETDKYKRLLRYIFLPLEEGKVLFINDYLVREGFAKVLTYPPDVKFNEQLQEAQKLAREQERGLWGRCK